MVLKIALIVYTINLYLLLNIAQVKMASWRVFFREALRFC